MPSSTDRFELSGSTLEAWCKRQGYTYTGADGQLAVQYALLGQPAPLLFLPHFDRGMVMMAMRQPFTVPAARAAAVTQAVNSMNATSFMGAWVLNTDTGELFFRATVVALDTGYSDASLLHAARVVVGTSELAAAGMRAIALDGADPVTTVAAIQPARPS